MDTSFYLTLGAFLVGVGFLLLVGDLFAASGVLLALAIASIAVGLVLIFRGDPLIGLYVLIGLIVAVPVFGRLLLRLLPHTPLGQLVKSVPSEEEQQGDIPYFQELQRLVGQTGKTLTVLKPGGMVDFDGRRVDCITEGMMVDPGHWVRCVAVRGGTVVVRPVDRPDSFDLETAIFN